ncbi:MAG TPA: hypothetical protein PLP33_27895 [Leptospiraceae bacterium]|nr:hypothetical protein [Leptospiraceae bacterium]
MNEELNELAELQPKTTFVIVGGESFEIKPFKFKHMFAVLNHLSNIVTDVNPYEDQMVQLFRLLGKHPEDVLGIMSLAVGKPTSFFDDIDTDQGIELAAKIWEINQDFFVRKVQPKLERLGLYVSQSDQKSSETTPTNEKEQENQ